MDNVLVTGACSRIGDSVCSGLLKKGYHVTAVDEKLSDYNKDKEHFTFVAYGESIKGTLAYLFENYKFHAVVHLACTADNDMGPIFTDKEAKISQEFDRSLYRMAVETEVAQFILISTTQVYMKVKTREPLREIDADIKPITNYAKMKYESEKVLANESKRSKTMVVAIARVPQVYSLKFYDNLVSKIKDPKDGSNFIYRLGDYGFHFCCIHNLSDFILCYLKQAEDTSYSGVYNVCDMLLTSTSEIIKFMKSNNYRLGPVLQRSEPKENNALKFIKSKIISSEEKTNYRYLDYDTILNNTMYDNRKANKICPFRWNISNTK